MNQRRLLVGAIPTAAVLGGLASFSLFGGSSSRPVQAQDAAALTTEQKVTASSLEGAFMRIADTVGPAAVSITAQIEEPVQQASVQNSPRLRVMPGVPGGGNDDPFAELFGPGNSPFARPQPRARQGQARGSGVIVRSNADGTTYILTNDHVVENAKNNQVRVTLADDSTYTGQVYRDFKSDLAVVKIKANKPLPFVKLANSDALHVGQWAIAIGSPFGQQNTMTTGIVSALHRKKEIGDGDDGRLYNNLIQTDASINPGNSGGPLLNINGEMIGLNVAIFSPTGTNAGIGYAIPANTARRIVDQLIATGKVTRSALGVEPSDIASALRQKLGTASGAYINAVTPNSAAEAAGILPGDVVTKFGDTPVTDEADLRDAITSTMPGTTVPVTILREGKTQTVSATPKPADSTAAATDTTPAPAERRPARELGMELAPLPAQMRSQLNLGENVKGVFVTGVMSGSPAADAGLTPRTVITQINNKPVTTAADLNKVASAAKPGDILVLTTERYSSEYGNKPVRGIVNIVVP